MTPELKLRWINGLRSGEYKQGQGFLRQLDKHCAIGVLCAVDGRCSFTPANDSRYPGLFVVDGPDGIGASRYICDLIADKAYHAIVSMNDDGRTFSEIADYIEREL